MREFICNFVSPAPNMDLKLKVNAKNWIFPMYFFVLEPFSLGWGNTNLLNYLTCTQSYFLEWERENRINFNPF